MKRIYLVDVSSLFFRAFYAVRPLTSPKGLPVNAIYGFLSMILKLMKDEKPDAVVFCYDLKEPSFRKDLYNEYKANRSEMPEDLVPQIPFIKQIANDLGIPSVEKVGFEADDLIGTMVQLARKHEYEVFIVSGDKDFAQLLTPHVWIFDTMKNTKIGVGNAKEKYGVEPHQMIDYLALIGDSSDNIPGVHGIGPKGAQKLIEQFGTLEGIYDHLDEIKGSTHEKLKADRDSAFLSKKLVTIVCDVPVKDEIENYHLRPADQKATLDLMTELNFKGFAKAISELPNWGPSVNGSKASTTVNHAEVNSKKVTVGTEKVAENLKAKAEVNSLIHSENSGSESVESAEDLAFKSPAATLTTAVDLALKPFEQKEGDVAMFASAFKKGQPIWGFQHELGFVLADEDQSVVYLLKDEPQALRNFLDDQDFQWKGFDLKALWHGLELKSPKAAWDGQLASYVVKAGESTEWENVYTRALGHGAKTLPTLVEKINELMHLELALDDKLNINRKIYSKLELPLLPVLYQMERAGLRLDQNLLSAQSQELVGEISQLVKDIYKVAGEEFNIGSPKQLAVVLFEKMKLPAGRKTKTGYSTDNEVLEKLRTQSPIADFVLQYRELTKLKSTYLDALPLLIKDDGRIHTTFNQVLTATGRLSSTDPNLQNIPIRTERGTRVRRAFIASPGMCLMSIDYSQVELRILAHYADDRNMIQAFHDDIDIHSATAAEIFNLKLSEVTSQHRRTAKAVNFGIAYGQGAFGLAEVLGIPRGEAQEIIRRYFERFSGVKNYIEETVKLATQQGYVETLFGRRRYMDELKSSNPAVRKFGERAAINAPIQGTAADLVKEAMIEVFAKTKTKLILQVHDELIFEGPKELLEQEAPGIVKTMESVCPLKVPLKVNWAIGSNWDEAHA